MTQVSSIVNINLSPPPTPPVCSEARWLTDVRVFVCKFNYNQWCVLSSSICSQVSSRLMMIGLPVLHPCHTCVVCVTHVCSLCSLCYTSHIMCVVCALCVVFVTRLTCVYSVYSEHMLGKKSKYKQEIVQYGTLSVN